MTRNLLSAAAICLALAGCQDQTEPDGQMETAEEVAERGAYEARRDRAVQDPETGVYVPATAGDPGGTSVSEDSVGDVYGATDNAARDAVPQGAFTDTGPDASRMDTLRERDAEAELVRARRACDGLPEADRAECREQADAAHPETLRDEAPDDGGATTPR